MGSDGTAAELNFTDSGWWEQCLPSWWDHSVCWRNGCCLFMVGCYLTDLSKASRVLVDLSLCIVRDACMGCDGLGPRGFDVTLMAGADCCFARGAVQCHGCGKAAGDEDPRSRFWTAFWYLFVAFFLGLDRLGSSPL